MAMLLHRADMPISFCKRCFIDNTTLHIGQHLECLPHLQVYKGVRRRVQEVAVKRLAPGTCHDEWLRRLQVWLAGSPSTTQRSKPLLRARVHDMRCPHDREPNARGSRTYA